MLPAKEALSLLYLHLLQKASKAELDDVYDDDPFLLDASKIIRTASCRGKRKL